MAKSRSAKAIILASSQALTTLVKLISFAVLARVLCKEDYATYRQTILAFTFATPFLVMGLDCALVYFLPTEKQRPRGVLVENVVLLTFGGLLFALLLVGGGAKWLAWQFGNPALQKTLLIFAPCAILMLPAASYGGCLLARGRAEMVAVFNVLSRLVILLAVVVPVLLWPSPEVAVTGMVAANALVAAVALALMFRVCADGDWRPTLGGMRKQLGYSIPLGMASLSGIVNRNLDKVLVSVFCLPATFAVYVNGAMEIPLVGIITGSVTYVLLVDYTTLYAEGRTAEIVALIHRAMVKCALILIPAMFFLLCTAPELMRVLYGAAYTGSAAPFRVYLLVLPARTLMFGAVFMATGNSRHVMIPSILTVIANAVLSCFAIQLFGAIGAAMASVCVVYLIEVPYMTWVLIRVLKSSLRDTFPYQGLLKVFTAGGTGALAAVLAKQVLQGTPDILILAVAGAFFGIVTVLVLSRFGLIRLSSVLPRWPGKAPAWQEDSASSSPLDPQ
jgi:O-antigen/teichoic acid export membrane protein